MEQLRFADRTRQSWIADLAPSCCTTHNEYRPISGRPKPRLQLASICMTRHTQPVPLCVQPSHKPARQYVAQQLLSNECPPTCSTGSLAGFVPNMAIISVANTFSVTFCRSLGPYHGAIAVPSVTRCRCRCRRRGHRCAGGVRRDSSDTW